jgi:hypothetical protein
LGIRNWELGFGILDMAIQGTNGTP